MRSRSVSRLSSRSRSSSAFSRRSTADSSSALMGLRMYSDTFLRMACLAYSKSSKPEKITNLETGRSSVRLPQSSSPSINGILMSVRTTSGRISSASSSASRPLEASPAREKPRPCQSIFRLIPSRIFSSSSTSSTRYSSTAPPPLPFTQSIPHPSDKAKMAREGVPSLHEITFSQGTSAYQGHRQTG